jgi:hypothetical protein
MNDWNFEEPGAARYKDTRFYVSGVRRRLLHRLARQQGIAVADEALEAAVGNPGGLARGTLRSHMRRVADLLAEHFPDARIERAEQWPNGAYRLTMRDRD